MSNMTLTQLPIAKTGMLIRKPVEAVFEAIVNPKITSKFWFSKGSARLETGKQVRWEWESHAVSIDVTVRVIEPNRRVLIEWPGYTGPTEVEWTFQAIPDGTTFVRVRESVGQMMPTGWCATSRIPHKVSRSCSRASRRCSNSISGST
jgi:uncharacterized protein YndB with AHSA1/START domain